ncbi:hypothetical protein [Methanococcoides seepicolus]|uniref:Uncharacterized protein n=1 Tax=Methanococcoides seepicolus TaxID=2828780 RepID=A0A9E5DA30_9EURY|nr:hypothetical protein [Methanococcoides seepicolus]MCM1985886.1 hypothetical protein [Methanococcoides seepicolus]
MVAVEDSKLIRRERVKAMLLMGCSKAEIAEELGVHTSTISCDVHAISQVAILEQAKDATSVVFAQYQQDIEWAVDQARKMQEALVGPDDMSPEEGRIDALGFIVKTRKESLELAQKLGLLEQVAEKKDVNLNVAGGLLDPATIKQFGDYMACHANEVNDEK